MAEAAPTLDPEVQTAAVQRVKTLAWVTVIWLVIDGTIGMSAGVTANSVVLIGWGLDCAIQAAAALVIIWRYTGTRVQSRDAERLAQRVVGASFFLLAPYIAVVAIDHLATGNAAGASWLGIALAASDAALMPFVGRAKQRVGATLGSHATRSEGRQNVLCAYLSVAVLLGLTANALFGWWWADPMVALLVGVAVVQAGLTSWRGDTATAC
ncbi:MAG: putative conserved integral rane protein [Marmoricola sp.]|jgi:divalent metal cation (Fe/Co/Zn/Cd) transporter|nr:putative conserved integral rane protein [Marmoricola sp.]